jgi:DNA invertase Pin-like site-specific DNA recombinase
MKRGVRFGRPAKRKPEQVALGQRLIDEEKSAREVTKMFNVHAATLYRELSDPAATAKAA